MKNDDWMHRDLAHVWHPCSQMKDHEWLPMVFDEVDRPFFGVMPYAGEEMLGWSFRR